MRGFEKFKDMINNSNYKKIIYNLIALMILCMIALLSWDVFFPKSKNTSESKLVGTVNQEEIEKSAYQDSVEQQLKHILSQIRGVGEVEVMITYESTSEVVPAINTTRSSQLTEEKDAQGGTRTTKQEDQSESIITSSNGTAGQVIVLKEIKPQIRGVVVVAEGAGDIAVKTELIEAVKTIFQIPAHKVMVYEKK
ncbi:stage III sporulation protein AG [Thermotalea metallivorans]|uniref:Stage III sporulation protein AG n=1 Tax=Thermotalea metallivorans TaxID=520762 RepID=A0A140L8C2_9FIRM|nr:stage III sporulation protein AG [Thermotalea metallivorans]KXG76797.1 hypothetical protein AN619_07890 [Thermotalea metallivorans]